jgi:uncharacterized protein (TIGR03437 family)
VYHDSNGDDYIRASILMASNKFNVILTFLTVYSAGLAVPAAAQTFDTSGNGKLKGDYFVRQVVTTDLNTLTSAIGRAISLTGSMSFDGNGRYIFTGQKLDTQVGGSAVAFSTAGTYAVASNGMAQIQNPMDSNSTATEYGAIAGVGPVAIVASATEGVYNDVFVAVQAGSGASNSSVSGSYNVGFIDFLQYNASQVRDGYYTLASSGNGSFGTVNVNGSMANRGSHNVTQTFSGVTYSITSGNGAGTLAFPTASTPLTALVSGQKTFYVSSDGNLLLGGDPNGFDLIIGIKSLSGSAANSMYQGTYYNAGLENNLCTSSAGIDSFYGSTLALGSAGAAISHQRLTYFDQSAMDDTFSSSFDFATNGTYHDDTFQYLLGVNGQAVLMVGTGTYYSLIVNLSAQPSQATSVFIDPLSIFNAASYAPITNPVAPGEFVTIFGAGLSSVTQSAQSLPLSANLGNVQVTVNGRPAPLDFVSPGQINLLIPFATSEPFATFQVKNNGSPSNQVTVYTNLTAPGVFTLTNLGGTYPAGLGPAAVLHADYSLVTADSPAIAGETLQLYVTGLGAVTPPVADGAAGPSNPPSTVNEYPGSILIDLFDQAGVDTYANVTFAGLAPGYPGLYQINFVVPSGVASGPATVGIQTNEAYTSEATLFMQ